MPKHKRPAPGKHPKQVLTPAPVGSQQGLRAFQLGQFDQAIAAWTGLAAGDTRVAAALAEAHFRRGLSRPTPAGRIVDLQRAIALAPAELRYQYHLALTQHRAENQPAAIKLYRLILAQNPAWPGGALALGLALLEEDPTTNLATLPGSTAGVQAALAPVQALLRGRPVPPAAADTPLFQLWQGLSQVQAGAAAAVTTLADARPLPTDATTAIRRYYHGVAQAQAGNLASALQSWQRLYAEHWLRDWLLDNLAAATLGQLRALQESGDQAGATALAEQAGRHPVVNAALSEGLVQVLDTAAQDAACSGDWTRAAALWEAARTIVGNSAIGSTRPLLHNLALAYEAQEQWLQAADTWRAMLRTRPRKPSRAAPSPDGEDAAGGLSDAEWAWARRRVIECYKRAGAPEEAVSVYRTAIKADPANLDTRLELVEALIANDQEQAAANELRRILEIDPQHFDAQLRLASLYMAWGEWYYAERGLRYLLGQQPDREDVRRQLARLLLLVGQQRHGDGQLAGAIQAFTEGQALMPADYEFPLNLARVALDQRDRARARPLLDRVLELAGDQATPYAQVIECWAIDGQIAEARAVLERAESSLTPTADFYVNVGVIMLKVNARPPPANPFAALAPPAPPADTEWTRLGTELLDRAVARRPEDATLRTHIAGELLTMRPDLALAHAEVAARLAPDNANTLTLLGLLQGLNGQVREGKETLRRAIRVARQQNNPVLAGQIEEMRQLIGSPLLQVALQMGPLLGDFDPDEDFF